MACELAKIALAHRRVGFWVNERDFEIIVRERKMTELNGGMIQDGCAKEMAGRLGAGVVGGCPGCGLHVAIMLRIKPEG